MEGYESGGTIRQSYLQEDGLGAIEPTGHLGEGTLRMNQPTSDQVGHVVLVPSEGSRLTTWDQDLPVGPAPCGLRARIALETDEEQVALSFPPTYPQGDLAALQPEREALEAEQVFRFSGKGLKDQQPIQTMRTSQLAGDEEVVHPRMSNWARWLCLLAAAFKTIRIARAILP